MRQIRQQSAQHVQEHCIILILNQKHLEKITYRLKAKSVQGLKWPSQENWGGNQDGWWDYPKKDQETWQARTKVGKHWKTLGTYRTWTEMLKKVLLVYWVYALILYPGQRKLQGTNNKSKAIIFLSRSPPAFPSSTVSLQLHLDTSPKSELQIFEGCSCLSPLCYWDLHLQKLPANPASSLSQPDSGMRRGLLWCLSQHCRAQGRSVSTTFSCKAGSLQHFTYI